MRLVKVRVTKYRSIRDSGWFDVEKIKTILVGPNEAGKTALLQALQKLNAPAEVAGFDPLRDYPRSELNDIDTGKVDPAKVTVVEGHFSLDDEDEEAVKEIDPGFKDCKYIFGRRLDNKWWHRIEGGPDVPTYGQLEKDLLRMAAYADRRQRAIGEAAVDKERPSDALQKVVANWVGATTLDSEHAAKLNEWLKTVILPVINEEDTTEENRYDRLMNETAVAERRSEALEVLKSRLPIFVYFSNYFRVKPSIHLEHLAFRLERNLLEDDQYDFGNKCLLKLLGFSARELSDLGKAAEPELDDAEGLVRYRNQLDTRAYKLNAASVDLTKHIQTVWNPDQKRDEASKLRIQADQQYLKVVVEDELGVEIELDQRSEGFQWLVSFFIVFFAETAGEYENAILLLDEPGLSLHGLKQRDFRTTVSRLGEDNQLIYSTHSPFLVGPDELDLVRVVEMTDRSVGTKVHTSITAGDSAALLPLQEALGYDLAQSLFAQQRNLVLEGLTDLWYLDATAHLLREAGTSDLNQSIALLPAESAGKVVYFATILHAHKLKVAALLDSDSAGDNAACQDTLVHTLGNKNILRTKDVYHGPVSKPEVEDLLRSTLLAVGRDDLGWDVSAMAVSQPSRPIVDVFKATIGNTFSKYKLAKAYLRWTRGHVAADLSTDEQDQWTALIAAINKSLR